LICARLDVVDVIVPAQVVAYCYSKENIDKIERVQRRAARYVYNNYDYSSSVTTMLENLKWQPLEERRMNTRLCLLYKAVNGLVAIPVQQYLIPLLKLCWTQVLFNKHRMQVKCISLFNLTRLSLDVTFVLVLN
jgi:hypothetical protein